MRAIYIGLLAWVAAACGGIVSGNTDGGGGGGGDCDYDYGSCSLARGVLLTCQSGAWQRASVMCPL